MQFAWVTAAGRDILIPSEEPISAECLCAESPGETEGARERGSEGARERGSDIQSDRGLHVELPGAPRCRRTLWLT